MPSLRIKRGARAQIDAAALASGLDAGELYLITDEDRIAVGTSASTYASTARLGDPAPFTAPYVPGAFYDGQATGTASTTLTGAAGRIEIAPFIVSRRLTVDQVGLACATAVAGAFCRAVAYASGADGWPDALIWQGGDLDCSTIGAKAGTLTHVFEPHVVYWLGVHHSSTAAIRANAAAASLSLGLNGPNGSNYFTSLRRTVTYASGAPATWGFVAAHLAANVATPSVRMRVL